MRILWLSNAPWSPSGYGEQTALFLPRFQALGHEVAAVANFGVHVKVDKWHGIDVYPCDNAWGNRSLASYAKHFKADTVIALCDAFVLDPDRWPDDLKATVWAPIDHYPVPPPVLQVLAHEKITPMAMSQFGLKQMRDCKLDPLYVPHAVDTQAFRPRPELRDQVRDALEIPRDAFLVGMVAANKDQTVHRKSFPQAFIAFSRFAQAHPDAYMYAHTEANPLGGMNLDQLAHICGVPDHRLRFPGEDTWHLGIPKEALAMIYQAFDVLLAPSMGEGFGIPILEAQACGVPVITSDHSAMRELTQAGWLVHGDPWWDEAAKSFFIVPFIDSILARLESAYEARGDLELRAAAVELAQRYEVERVLRDFWLPALEAAGPPVSRQVRRARERAAKKKPKVAA